MCRAFFLRSVSQPVFSYAAGQYVEVVHKDRCVSPLSIACAPTALANLEFHLFHPVENHKAQDLLRIAQAEKTWSLRGPYGSCTVNRLHPQKPIIFLARGTGFAPIKAVIEALFISPGRCPAIHLYWSVSRREDFYLTDLLEKWKTEFPNFIFTPVLTREFSPKAPAGSPLLHDIVLRDYLDLSAYQVYASGPRPLVNAAFYAFQKHGLQQTFFYSDVFG